MSITSLIIKIGAKDEEIQKALASVGVQAKSLDANLAKLGNTPLGAATQKSLETLQKSMKSVTDAQQKIADKASDAARGVEFVGGASKLTNRELISVNKTLQDGLSAYQALGQKAPAEIQKVADAVTKKLAPALSMEKIVGGLKSGGAALTAALTVPLVGLGAVATKAASDFETSFAGVRKTVDGVVDQFGKLTPAGEKLQQGFRDLSKVLPVSVNELNRIGEAAGQLGIKQGDILQFTEVMAKLGVTTNLSSDQAANAVARIQNIFGAAGKETDRLASAIVALGNAGASTESEIVEFGLRIAGAGKLAGLAQSDVLSIGSALASVGVEAEAGGTAVQKVLLEMVTAIQTGSENVGVFARASGMSAAAFTKAFKTDAAGAFTAFVEGLGKQGNAAISVLSDLGLEDARLIRSFLSLAGAGDLLRDSIKTGSEAWKVNTALTKEADQRFQTFASQMQLFKNQLGDVAITLGNALLPTLRELLELSKPAIGVIANLAQSFSNLPDGVKTAALGVGAFLAALGPGAFIVGSFAGAITNLLPLMKALAATQAAGGLAGFIGLLANPVVATAAIALAGGAAAAYKFNQQIGEMEARAKAAIEPTKDLSGQIRYTGEQAKAALDKLGDVTTGLTFMGKAIGATSAVTAAYTGTTTKLTAAQKAYNKALGEYNSVANTAQATVDGMNQATVEGIRFDLARGISQDTLSTIYKVTKEQIAALIDVTKEQIATDKASAKALDETIDRMQAFSKVGQEGAAAVAKGMIGMSFVLRDLAVQMGDVQLAGKQFNNQVLMAMPDLADEATLHMQDLRGELVAVGQTLREKLRGELEKIPQTMADALTGGGGVMGGLKAIASGIGSAVGGSIGKAVGGPLGESIGKALGSLAGPLVGAFGKLFGITAEKTINPIRQAFVDLNGGLAALNVRAAAAGVTLTAMLNAKNPEQYKKAIDELNAAFQLQEDATAALDAAIQKYGFSIEQLGPALQRQEMGKQAEGIFKDWTILNAAGIETIFIAERMAESINAYVAQAMAMGIEVPASMRPMLQTMIDQGLLTDAAGNKITDLGESGITFAETMSQGFQKVVDAVTKLANSISGTLGTAIAKIPTSIDVGVNLNAHWNIPDVPHEFAAQGGLVTAHGMQRFAAGGTVLPFRRRGSDSVPAMLTPGELILNEAQQGNVAAAMGGGGRSNDAATLSALTSIAARMDARDRSLPKMLRDAALIMKATG